MNVEYGEGQSRQRSTLIENIDGICGPFHDVNNPHHVKLNTEQHMCFQDENEVTDNDGPFWMSVNERMITCYDVFENISLHKQRLLAPVFTGQVPTQIR